MAKYRPFRMVLNAGTTYYTPKDVIIKVEKIATNSTTDAYLWIKTARIGPLISEIAPMTISSSNFLGPLSLRDRYLVIPRESDFKFEGASGSQMLLEGQWILLDKPDEVPKELAERGLTQFKDYYMYIRQTTSLAVDQKLPANGEVEILSLTPKAIEKFILNNYLGVKVTNYTPSYGELALRFFYDNGYLETLTDLPGSLRIGGIDVKKAPHPPALTADAEYFTLENNPVTVEGNHTLKIYVRNIKGSDIAPSTGTALTFDIYLIVNYVSQ